MWIVNGVAQLFVLTFFTSLSLSLSLWSSNLMNKEIKKTKTESRERGGDLEEKLTDRNFRSLFFDKSVQSRAHDRTQFVWSVCVCARWCGELWFLCVFTLFIFVFFLFVFLPKKFKANECIIYEITHAFNCLRIETTELFFEMKWREVKERKKSVTDCSTTLNTHRQCSRFRARVKEREISRELISFGRVEWLMFSTI